MGLTLSFEDIMCSCVASRLPFLLLGWLKHDQSQCFKGAYCITHERNWGIQSSTDL